MYYFIFQFYFIFIYVCNICIRHTYDLGTTACIAHGCVCIWAIHSCA